MKKLMIALLALSWPLAKPQTELPAADQDRLLYLIEEEKLAMDVYNVFEAKWGAMVFNHISEAEQRHFERAVQLAKDQGVKVPKAIEKNKPGEFWNKDLQALYNKLTASGNQSLEAALRAGALIEETDIRDLKVAYDATDNESIRATYEYLIDASGNHLRAFNRNLANQGADYKPVALDQEVFDAIIADESSQKMGQGKGKGQGCQGEGKGGGKGCCQQAGAQNGQGGGQKGGCCQGQKGQGCKAKSRK